MNPESSDRIAPEGIDDVSLPKAVALHQAGDFDGATAAYAAILDRFPQNFDATHLLGVIALQQGRLKEAQQVIGSALEWKPDDLAALGNLTTAYIRDRKFDEALGFAERAIGLAPHSFDALVNLGNVLYSLGRFQAALIALREARSLNPGSADVAHLMGACLLESGDPQQAAELFQAALHASPRDGGAWTNLAVACNAAGDHQRALECAEQAVTLQGDGAVALAALAAAQEGLGLSADAVATHRKLTELAPSPARLCALASALIKNGEQEPALHHLRRAVALDATDPVACLMLAVAQLKPICASVLEIEASRRDFSDAVAGLLARSSDFAKRESHTAIGTTFPFYLPYQPFNNRDLLMQYGRLTTRWMSHLPACAVPARAGRPPNRKMRIGIASSCIRNHSVWVAVAKGWVEQLDKSRFDAYLFRLGGVTDTSTENAKAHAAHFESGPKDLTAWVDAIRKAELDLLIYPEIGMEPLTAQLASLRLAPLQATTWGHPETSGLPTVDFYLSGADLEPPDAQQNYSERLVCLPNLSVYVAPLKPKIWDPNLRALGLPKREPLLLCPGMPFKYSPLHDHVWVTIAKGLEANRTGRLVFFAGNRGWMYKQLESRLREVFERAAIDFDARVCIIPQVDRSRFFGLMQHSALMLDTIGFSGFNTALQAIECGLPILAFEGAFMRGRLASCLMRRMDLPELIARSEDEFIERAINLAGNERERKRLRTEIANRRHVLFEDEMPIKALERFLAEAITRTHPHPDPVVDFRTRSIHSV
jgi:predicted O-linked N-acetylglucosamine transferase (SPINDLY family)